MDKWMDNPWFIKILALVLAVLLYSSVHPGSKDVNVPSGTSTDTIKDVPVKVYYDTENLVVTGIPDTVDLTIKGPNSHVQSAKALQNFEVYVNLTNVKVGKQKVTLKVKNLSDKLTATISPATVNVTVQERITKEFKVDAEFNKAQIEAGYSAGQPIVEPSKVKITGAKNVIDKITYVKATVEEKNKLKETITREASIQVLDKELNKLDVEVNPATVKVTIPIKDNTKTVPIDIVKKGTAPSGITIQSIELDTQEATIMADEDVLKSTDSVRVEVDISSITENTTLDLPVIIPSGVIKVSPQLVKVKITVKKQEEKTISGIPLNIRGLSESYDAVITDPATGKVNLIVNGQNTALAALKPEDFTVYIDLANLTEGNHEVNIYVEGPPNVNWKADKSTAKITITKNKA